MITPKELLAKADKIFFKIISAHLKGESIFPLLMPSNKQVTGSNFSDWKNDLVPLYQQSKALKQKGYSVDWKEKIINGSKQSVPSKIYFDTIDDFLHFIGKEKDSLKIQSARDLLMNSFPLLEQWANDNPEILLSNYSTWSDIIKVCKYFESNQPPHQFYIRELPIEVHSKFIEQNAGLLKRLLDLILPDGWKNIASNDLSERYFLRKVSVYTQIRILDDELKPHLGYDECSLTLEDAAWIKWVPENVFIIENQICFLTFPKVKNSVAIFGEGFKSRLSKDIPWLKKTNLYCWFDLDTAGFEMLNMVRGHYPKAIGFLMDEKTYAQFQHFSVYNKGKQKVLPLLSPEEQNIYQFLMDNNKRLEQERISQSYIQINLK
ncbi:Wadjet anti-phage system protein JetD domain-containing protein [Sediminibacterium sp.]|uniref:Wadjet anti-phage system protein JetD domain-containing protein n=1 Tax=Sediminibacterium sp. TaxID=1917865 RepID=UPI0025EB7D6C|nr:Wadjet anti-phage system protein JetD domain-containing protein [Sediminibacterium sp.]